ncbi:MAG: ComEC/Rec2 family competence protein [Micrococcales bacterium]|nr:ComEC/Rec2 family competence protein [Micrococcales bacterium]MCL2666419.1 ComEC/Rec2 family competence protein [Micrococcales bacterium]
MPRTTAAVVKEPEEVADPVDLRLVPVAAGAWAGAFVVVLAPVRWCVISVGCCLVVMVLGALRRDRWAGSVVLVAGVAAAVLGAGAAQQHARWSGQVADAVAERRTVTVTATTQTVPTPTGYRNACRYLVTVSQLDTSDQTTTTAAPVRVEAPCQQLAPGTAVAVTGRLGPVRAGRAVGALRTNEPAREVAPAPTWSRAADTVRDAGHRRADVLPAPLDSLLPGIVWGDTSGLDDQTTQDLRVAGLTHLTAVSGAHFAIVLATVLAVGAALRLPRMVRTSAAVLAGVGLVVLVGPQPSVLRAAVMGAVGVVALMVGRRSAAPAALCTTIVVLLLVDPWLATEVGFQLSVAATVGIIALAGLWVRRWSRWVPQPLAMAVSVPLSAQLAVMPVLLTISPQVPTYAVFANLAVAPVVAPVTVIGLLGLVASVFWPAGAQVLVWLAGAGCAWIVLVARTAARAPGATVAWLPGPAGLVVCTGAVVAVAVLATRRRQRAD